MINFIGIQGYKSIKNCELNLQNINILIGSNGAGKSNFISIFKLLKAIFSGNLQKFILQENADKLLYFGTKHTESLDLKIIFSENDNHNNAYKIQLESTNENGLYISKEASGYNVTLENINHNYFNNFHLLESEFSKSSDKRNVTLKNYINSIEVFHFHDTTNTSALRKSCDINNNDFLIQDGRNLPAYLYLVQENHPILFKRIVKTIQSVAPYIEKFILKPNKLKKTEIELRWVDTGDIDSNFSAYQLSDGTLRFIALATLLMQPHPPAVIVIDESELGLHPIAIGKLAAMMQNASVKSQLIVATQSPSLISCFTPNDIIVMDRSEEQKQTIFNRLDNESLSQCLTEYSLGDLWERNIINAAQPFHV